MANWKKVIVSGSNAELNHITSSATISASGKLFGGLQVGVHDEVVIYDTSNGELKYKVLNLINTSPAPFLFGMDQSSPSDHDTHFKISHAAGNSELVGSSIYPYIELSASLSANGVEQEITNNLNFLAGTINGEWSDVDVTQTTYYTPSSNTTSSFGDARDGLDLGQETADVSRTFHFQRYDSTNGGAVPAFDTTQANLNYGVNAFNDGGLGELRFFVNDNVTPRRTFDLSANVDVVSNDTLDGITINLFATQSNLDGTTGDVDPNRHYRSGSFTVTSTHQRDGYNYAFVIHTGSKDGNDFAYITNFSEWFYDAAGAAADLTDVVESTLDVPIFDSSSAGTTASISGIKFFKTAGATNTIIRHAASTTNYFKNVYPTEEGVRIDQVTTNTIDNIHHTQSGDYQLNTGHSASITSPTFTNDIDVVGLQDVANASTSDLQVTASFDVQFSANAFHQPPDFDTTPWGDLSGTQDIKFRFGFDHIGNHKDVDTVNGDTKTFNDFLVNTLTVYATEDNFEDFRGEEYRLVSRSYATGDTASISSYAWDGEQNVVTSTVDGHNSGSIIYNTYLVYPTASGDGGTYTTTYGPNLNQPDYSGAVGEREYFRYFKVNADAQGAKQVNIEFVGTGKVVTDNPTSHYTDGDQDGVKVEIWRSGPGSISSLYYGTFLNVIDNDIRVGSSVGNSNYIQFASTTSNLSYTANDDQGGGVIVPTGVVKLSDSDGSTFKEDDWIILRIRCAENWKGNLNAIALTFGNYTGTPKLGTSGYTPI